MGYVYQAKEPIAVVPEVPDGWPGDWTIPLDPGDPLDPGETDGGTGPWPPGWPLVIGGGANDYSVEVDIPTPPAIGLRANVVARVLDEFSADTNDLKYHVMQVSFSVAGEAVGCRKDGADNFSTYIYYQITNYDGSSYGIDEDIGVDLIDTDKDKTLTCTCKIVSVAPNVSGTGTATIGSLPVESAGVASVTANLSYGIKGTSNGVATVSGTLSYKGTQFQFGRLLKTLSGGTWGAATVNPIRRYVGFNYSENVREYLRFKVPDIPDTLTGLSLFVLVATGGNFSAVSRTCRVVLPSPNDLGTLDASDWDPATSGTGASSLASFSAIYPDYDWLEIPISDLTAFTRGATVTLVIESDQDWISPGNTTPTEDRNTGFLTDEGGTKLNSESYLQFSYA